MANNICPACGSHEIIKVGGNEPILEPYSDGENVTIINYICNTCHSEGDFFDENVEEINNAIVRQNKNAVSNILNYFIEHKVSLSSIERALSLPQRTLTKWKNGITTPSAAGVSLLKIIRTFPWLLEVAENQYDYNLSQQICAHATVNYLFKPYPYSLKKNITNILSSTNPLSVIMLSFDKPFETESKKNSGTIIVIE